MKKYIYFLFLFLLRYIRSRFQLVFASVSSIRTIFVPYLSTFHHPNQSYHFSTD